MEFHIFGPIKGQRNDMAVFRQLKLNKLLYNSLMNVDEQFYTYGDPTYVFRPYLLVGFKRESLK